MTDAVDSLATDYQELRLRTFPTWAHMIGDYGYVDQFEEVGLEAEDRQIAEAREFAARAEAIPVDGLVRPTTGSRGRWSPGTRRPGPTSSGPASRSSAPTRSSASRRACRSGSRSSTIPDADIAEGIIGKYHGIATYFRDLAGRHREGVAHGRTPADFAVRQTVEQIDRWLATPIAEDPLLRTADPAGWLTPTAWRAGCRDVVESDVRPGGREVPRHAPRRGPAARPRRRQVRADAGSPAATRPTRRLIRYYTTAG